jgi:IS4 transposase
MTTNLTKEQASSDTLCRLYALRWQIELFFKAIKSSIGIDKLKLISCEAIAKSYIWARLTYAVVMLSIRGFAQHELSEEIGMIQWFRRLETFLSEIRTFIQKGRWLALAKLIKKIATEWCKPQKRLRNTSWEKFNHAKAAETIV